MNDRHDSETADRLRAALDQLTENVAEGPPGVDTTTAESAVPSPGSRRRWVPLAAAAVAIVGTAGIVWVAGGGETPVADAPTLPANPSTDPIADEPLGSMVAVPSGSVPDSSIPSGRVELRALVLEDSNHGPQLCTGWDDTLPPGCGGPDITNWDWSVVEHDKFKEARWGQYVLVGTYDLSRSTFTLDGPVRQPGADSAAAAPDFSTPCPTPEGGWPETTAQAFQRAPTSRIERIEGFAGLWVDERNRVVNVRVVGDQNAVRSAIAEFYDGAVCVTAAEYTATELEDIQNKMPLVENAVATYTDTFLNRVILQVIFPDPELVAEMQERYGDRVIVQPSAVPIAAVPDTVPDSSVPSGPVEIVATVLESPEHGPQLCSQVLTSYPPQCGGPDITNWDWSAVEFEEANGTRWGEYLLVGSYEPGDGTFTLDGPALPPEGDGGAVATVEEPDFSTECPAPEGGWPEMSLADFTTTDFARIERAVDGFAGLWVDEPNRVVNVRVTGDQDAATAAIAAIFDGGICVTGADHTMAELTELQEQITLDDNTVATYVDVMLNKVVVEIQFPDPDLETRLAEQHGDKVTVVIGATVVGPSVGYETVPPIAD